MKAWELCKELHDSKARCADKTTPLMHRDIGAFVPMTVCVSVGGREKTPNVTTTVKVAGTSPSRRTGFGFKKTDVQPCRAYKWWAHAEVTAFFVNT